ncbi:MAG: hypothetical protein WAU34_14610, partial [Desulfobacterales bacterium]
HVDAVMTTTRDNHKDPHLRHPMVEQLSQLWRNKTAWGDFMKRGFAAPKTLSAGWLRVAVGQPKVSCRLRYDDHARQP